MRLAMLLVAVATLLAPTGAVLAETKGEAFSSATVRGRLVSVVSGHEGEDCLLWVDAGSKAQFPVTASPADCLVVDPGQELLIRAALAAVPVQLPAETRKPPTFRIDLRLRAVKIEVLSP